MLEHSYKYSAQTVPETSFRAAISGLALLPLLAQSPAHADETPCPSSVDESQVRPAAAPAAPRPDPASTSTEISGDKVEYNLHGHAVLSGNVLMQQGDRRIRADYLEYDAERQQALVKGGVEYSDPTIVLAIDDVQFATGLHVVPVLAPEAAIRDAIERHYNAEHSSRLDEILKTEQHVGADAIELVEKPRG